MSQFFLWIVLLFSTENQALEVHEQLADSVQEYRAKKLGDQLLCPRCGGQALNESAVEEAILLRMIIREQIVKGCSDQQIVDWFVDRYGERILVKPPLSMTTCILWFLPWLLLGGCLGKIFYRNNKKAL
ncbi:cytochrome c-type biogenesis protein [Candidatus Odyssella acanthamoebae]|uniref:cytochrome c-type biogenesis protein n=1 Tax=Candidatus Odyssella acanthamoebae TaxID=91604 RepID=UPI0006903FD8|nr:cytochrome c-type biogenesis protein CcmH [Candidatus Paracaedibacter acanthamoebae]